MAYPIKQERNDALVKDRDELKMSLSELSKKYGIKRHTALEVYKRAKAREQKESCPQTD